MILYLKNVKPSNLRDVIIISFLGKHCLDSCSVALRAAGTSVGWIVVLSS